jgi:hypothetical protein
MGLAPSKGVKVAVGNPAGGQVGSRHRQQLNGEFIAALLRDFRHGGPKAIERVRRTQPAAPSVYASYDGAVIEGTAKPVSMLAHAELEQPTRRSPALHHLLNEVDARL